MSFSKAFKLLEVIQNIFFKRFKFLCFAFALVTMFHNDTIAQNPLPRNHRYPLIGTFLWDGAVPEWYARFDLNMSRIVDADFIAQVRELNPNTVWLVMRDFNRADEFFPNFPDEWFLRDSKGNKISLYGGDTYWSDLSDLGVAVNGEKLLDVFPKHLAQRVTGSGSDGIATDGLYSRIHLQYNMFSDVDIDKNGVNDLNEHGKQWVIDHIANGVDQLLSNLRAEVGDDKIILINTGSTDTPGVSDVNGYVFEHVAGEYNWDYTRNYMNTTISKVRKPIVFLANQNPDGSDPRLSSPLKDYFSFVRFGLVRAMLLDIYWEYEDTDQHYWNRYYDEFDVDMGYPTGSAVEVKSGVWARFFDHGAVLINFTGTDVTVTDSEFSSANGYSGPYYRFQGGQDPVMNNGEQFTQVNLIGYRYGGSNAMNGDAILLVRNPSTVVSDIIIDNVNSGTSPGSRPPEFTGGWVDDLCNGGAEAYTLGCRPWANTFPFTQVSPGNGSETAVYRAGIGIAGEYEVFEWHGYLGSSPGAVTEATNVPLTISHANGTTNITVDQSTNYGKWNSLGVYQMTPGSNNFVSMTNSVNGPFMADAIKFTYKNSNLVLDTTPPIPPTGVRVEN